MFELQILDMIQKLHTPLGDVVMKFITSLGNAGVIWILLAAVLLIIPKTRKVGMLLTVALIFDLIICNGILKPLIARTRPFDVNSSVQLLIKRPGDYSFPSGHTAASFTAVAALYFAKEKKMGRIALLLAVLIAFSRLYFYVHYPTDVIGGVVVGLFCGWLGSKVIKY